jgi:hypothetical protein
MSLLLRRLPLVLPKVYHIVYDFHTREIGEPVLLDLLLRNVMIVAS